jgi:predicted dehydrogenase
MQDRLQLRSLETTPNIGIGFIGAGNFAKGVLMPALKRNASATLVGICTATGMSAVHTGKKNDFAIATTDYHELLNDRRINAIVIATRHDTHARFALDALEAGKHVFLEKPLCANREELQQFEEFFAHDKATPQLLVGFNRRFSPHARAVRAAHERRRTPMVITYRVNAGTIPKDTWIQDQETGGGRIVGELCHFVDLCEFLTGSTPVNVQAQCISSSDARITPEDSIVVTIAYADGSLATIQYIALGSSSMSKERIEIFADGSSAVIDDFVTTSFYGTRHASVKGKQDKGFNAEIAAFLNSIKTGSAPAISFDSIARTTRVTFDVLESLRSGKEIASEEVEAGT